MKAMKIRMILCAAVLLLCACGPKLVIVHTNDTHSHFDPDFKQRGGIVERAAFIDSVRRANGAGKVLLLHAGDWNQGTTYYSELGGSMEVDMVNALGYDAIALGNHEFDNGIEDLCERVKNVRCPVLCANLDLSPFELGRYVRPYTVLRRGGMKIGVIGLEATLQGCVSAPIASRIPQLDAVEVTNRWAKFLKEEERCDLVILLSHQGYKEDQENAAAIRNVDLVIGGHSHTFVEDFVYVTDLDGRQVPVVTDGRWGLEMGVVKVYGK